MTPAVPAPASALARVQAWRDDLQAIATGALLAAVAIVLFREAGLVPGGTIGLALLLHGATALPLWACLLIGGALCGLAILVLLRHHGSLGGLNILIVSLQRRTGWPPVWLQWGIDLAIVGAGALVLGDPGRAAASLLAVTVLNAVLAINHRPGRYRPAPSRQPEGRV